MIKADNEYSVRRLPQTTANSSRRRKPARAKKAGNEPPPLVLLFEDLSGAVSTTEKTETSAQRMQRRLRPDQVDRRAQSIAWCRLLP